MGFIIHLYIIFGTNLLTGGPAQNWCFFAYFRVSQKKNIKQSPNRMKPSGTWFLEQTWSRGLGVDVKQSTRRPWGREARPPPSRAPRSSLDRPLSPIYTHIPWKHHIQSQNPISTAATLCTRQIPSWGLFRRSAGGASITEGLYINTLASPMMCE